MDYEITKLPKMSRKPGQFDERGFLVEFLKREELKKNEREFAHIYLATIHPNSVRGNHYHTKQNEFFIILSGKAAITLEDIKTKKRKEIILDASDENLIRVRFGPYIAHAIKNISDETVYLAAYGTKPYDPKKRDQQDYHLVSSETRLSVVIPVYGSEKILEKAYYEFSKSASSVTNDYEILFRVDASPDNSEQLLKKITKDDKHAKIYSHKPNKGLGYTLRRLFRDAKGEYVIYFDADAFMSFDLTMLKPLLKKAENYDAIVASRYVKNPNVPLYRHFASWVYSIVNKMLFHIDIRDIGSGFVIFRRKALQDINLVSDGFDIHIEIFSKLAGKNCKIEEIPINYTHWKGGSFNILKHGPKTLLNTFKLWFKMFREK